MSLPIDTNVIYYAILPIVFFSIPLIIQWNKRQEISTKNSAISDYNINTMRQDLTEVKSDVKESRKEMQELKDNINIVGYLKEKVERVESKVESLIPRFEDALRNIELNKLRIDHLEKEGGGESK